MRWLAPWLLLAAPASAHRPGAIGEHTVVPDPTVSWVYAGVFETGDEVFTLELQLEQGIAIPIELFVPHRRSLEDHRPAYAVVGPGLPTPTTAQRAFLPLDAPAGSGVFIDENDAAEREVYFEQVMRRTLWTTGTIALVLEPGLNEIWVWSPDGTTGSFQIGFGVEEDFSGGAWSDLFADWSLYAW